ncbi:MAG: hypothetical protein HND48_15330 [Chloroflexi bacterium]|nr:hypothetical protein [Chloroflexota bacterium]
MSDVVSANARSVRSSINVETIFLFSDLRRLLTVSTVSSAGGQVHAALTQQIALALEQGHDVIGTLRELARGLLAVARQVGRAAFADAICIFAHNG